MAAAGKGNKAPKTTTLYRTNTTQSDEIPGNCYVLPSCQTIGIEVHTCASDGDSQEDALPP